MYIKGIKKIQNDYNKGEYQAKFPFSKNYKLTKEDYINEKYKNYCEEDYNCKVALMKDIVKYIMYKFRFDKYIALWIENQVFERHHNDMNLYFETIKLICEQRRYSYNDFCKEKGLSKNKLLTNTLLREQLSFIKKNK